MSVREDARSRLYDNFGPLLALLIVAFLVTGVDGSRWITLVAGLINVVSLLIGFASTDLDIRSRPAAALIGVGLVGAAAASRLPIDSVGAALGASAQAALLITLTVAVLKRIVRSHVVTIQTILGAIAAYLLIGQSFAWIYMALPGFTGEPVLDPPIAAGDVPVYYSYVTLTTLGFGDVSPAGDFAQRITVLEALLGQIFLAVLLAFLVSAYSSER